MNISTTRYRVILLAGFFLIGWRGTSHGQSIEEIFRWTAGQMKVSGTVAMPAVRIVSRAEIKRIFIENNRGAYLRWESDYGEDRAQEIMQDYLSEIVGLFDPPTGVVYVGDFLSPCRREAILAHEMTHYFQQKCWGPIEDAGPETQIRKWKREMEAYGNEEKYSRTFCPEAPSTATPE